MELKNKMDDKKNMNKRVCLVLTGTIGSVKAFDLTRLLVKNNYSVQIILTEEAKKIVSETSLEWASNNRVLSLVDSQTSYLKIAKEYDVFFVFATSNFISKIANGITDDLASLTITCAITNNKKVLVLPLMHKELYSKILIKNIEYLKTLNLEFIDPKEEEDKYKVPELDLLFIEIEKAFTNQSFAGKKAIISLGKTIEKIDDVRIITNIASGMLGYNIALELYKRGCEVTVIQGNTNHVFPKKISTHQISTYDELQELAKKLTQQSYDFYFSTIAVSDFKPVVDHSSHKEQIAKLSSEKEHGIRLIPREKVLKYFSDVKNLIIFSMSDSKKTFNYNNVKLIIYSDPRKYSKENLELIVCDKTNKVLKTLTGNRELLAKQIVDFVELTS
ncbi:MAG: hypothetical protein N3E37_00735 [Candidatus Micrarchaeota archaeon]|nr:hypothetical protein [Candidatus Micrarchaeota archaeon]